MTGLSSTLTSRAVATFAAVAAVAVTTLVPASGVEQPSVREPHRPHSADAAERWWLSCTATLPRSADAAARVAADCW
jgi:hypothetical protein